ncbi:MAG: hypothetical protein R6V00_05465 [Candidatus Aminicenantes bacterium]
MKNLGQAKILGVLALFFLLNASSYIKPGPDSRLEQWLEVEEWEGKISYLQINIKRGHYVLGISGIDAIPIRHREYKAVGGQVLIDVGTTITGQSLKRVWAHMDTPESSDFYEKVEAHEEHHLRQFDEIEP